MARTVHRILEDKREVLLKRLDELIREAAKAREEMANDLLQAYHALFDAYMALGAKTIEAIASVSPPRVELTVNVINMVNVLVPRLSVKVKGTEMSYGFADTSSSLDRATQVMLRALPGILKAAEVENAIFALAADLKKTQRLINGLEYVIIPKYEDSIKFISSTLAEREREDFVRLKHLKGILEQAKEEGAS